MGLPALVAWETGDATIQHGGNAETVLVMGYEAWKSGRAKNMRITLGANRFNGTELGSDDAEQIFAAMQTIEDTALTQNLTVYSDIEEAFAEL